MHNFYTNQNETQFICEDNTLSQKGFICEDSQISLQELAKAAINNITLNNSNLLSSQTSVTTSSNNNIYINNGGNGLNGINTVNFPNITTTNPVIGSGNFTIPWNGGNLISPAITTSPYVNTWTTTTIETELYDVMGMQYVLYKIYDTTILLTLAQINFHGYKFYLELLKVNFPFPQDLADALQQRAFVCGRDSKIEEILS